MRVYLGPLDNLFKCFIRKNSESEHVKIKEPYLKATVISTERARAVKAIMVSSFWLAWKSWARLWAKSWIPPEMELAPVPELIELEGTHLFRSGELKFF